MELHPFVFEQLESAKLCFVEHIVGSKLAAVVVQIEFEPFGIVVMAEPQHMEQHRSVVAELGLVL